jgi:hypothetical protein
MTHCATSAVPIPNIPRVENGFIEIGDLVITVESSQYNITSLRNAMIQAAALTAQQAATGENCYNQSYFDDSVTKRSLSSTWFPFLSKRDHPTPTWEISTFCNTVGFAGVNYFDPYWRQQASPGASSWIDAHWQFETPNMEFLCEILHDTIDVFEALAPEFAVGGITLGEMIDVICTEDATGDL